MQCVECGAPLDKEAQQLGSSHCFDCVLALDEPEYPAEVAEPEQAAASLNIATPEGMTKEQAEVWALQQPHILGAGMAYLYSGKQIAPDNPNAVMDALEQQQRDILQSDKLEGVQELLATQIQLLNMVFIHSMQRAQQQTNSKALDAYARIGLKAQSQCRMAADTLHSLRNPAPPVLRQTNIANGPQQVNNGVTHEQPKPEPAGAGVETVATLDRPENSRGQADSLTEQLQERPVYSRGDS